jgi:hypothetical protein
MPRVHPLACVDQRHHGSQHRPQPRIQQLRSSRLLLSPFGGVRGHRGRHSRGLRQQRRRCADPAAGGAPAAARLCAAAHHVHSKRRGGGCGSLRCGQAWAQGLKHADGKRRWVSGAGEVGRQMPHMPRVLCATSHVPHPCPRQRPHTPPHLCRLLLPQVLHIEQRLHEEGQVAGRHLTQRGRPHDAVGYLQERAADSLRHNVPLHGSCSTSRRTARTAYTPLNARWCLCDAAW